MHLEIERKFLVVPGIWQKADKPDGIRLVQGYLCQDSEKSIRVRIANEKASLTVKGKPENLGRKEFEYLIPIAEAGELLKMVPHPPIRKTRYKVLCGGKLWDVDHFHGANEGLFLAEIELEDPEEPFTKPEWIGDEVSDDPRYYNVYLSLHPFSTWHSNK